MEKSPKTEKTETPLCLSGLEAHFFSKFSISLFQIGKNPCQTVYFSLCYDVIMVHMGRRNDE
jgi:hypothetical protein